MKPFKYLICWFEVMWVRLINLSGFEKSKDPIPEGFYCYEYDREKNEKEPMVIGYHIKPCKYYRYIDKRGNRACTYTGFIGFDFSLYDACKICGEKHD